CEARHLGCDADIRAPASQAMSLALMVMVVLIALPPVVQNPPFPNLVPIGSGISVAVTPSASRKAPASATLTDAEAIRMMKAQVAWSATIGSPSVRVEGNKVTFRSPGVIVPMTGKTSVVEFEMTRSQ